jgi:hypothetical protein
MFMIPLLDMARLFVLRLVKGRHPFSADHEHLHHHLDRSIGWTYGRQIYYALVAGPIVFSRFHLADPLVVLLAGFSVYLFSIVITDKMGGRDVTA